MTPRKSSGAAIAARSPSRHRCGAKSSMSAGYVAAEDRVEEPAVRGAVELGAAAATSAGESVAGYVCVRLSVMPTSRAGRLAAEDLDRPAVREQQVMRRGDGVGVARAAGRVHAPAVAEPRGTHGSLCVTQRVDAVAEPPGDGLGVLGESLGGGARRPAALVLQRLRQVPVVERRRTARSRSRAARRRAGRRSRAPPRSPRRCPRAGCAATRSRSGTRRARARASAGCRRHSGGRSRTRRRRCRRCAPCPAWRRTVSQMLGAAPVLGDAPSIW